MRAIGLVLIVVVLFVGWRILQAQAVIYAPVGSGVLSSRPDHPATGGAPIQTPRQAVAAANPPSGLVTVEAAASWFSGPCAGRFEQTLEANGVLNPRSVHFRTGPPAGFAIPAGVYAQTWDCFAADTVRGPATLPQVCEATFREG